MRTAHAPAARAFCIAAFALFALLGVAWAIDRARRWDAPRIDRESFVVIRGEALMEPNDRPTWLMPINPGCPSCMMRARELSRSRPAGARGPRIVFLVVDQRKPPTPLALAELEADAIWWDARETWRRHWGHRVYGEILRFDPRGQYRGTTPPSRSPRAPGEEGGEKG